jgi:hypothetical protein
MAKGIESKWPPFTVHLGGILDKDGPQIRLALTYRGETRERLIPLKEFKQIVAWKSLRAYEAIKRIRLGRH